MTNIAQFEIVSFDNFLKGIEESIRLNDGKSEIEYLLKEDKEFIYYNFYKNIIIPKRSTKGSAGYDFFFPFDKITLKAGESIVVPTGIKAKMLYSDCFLGIYTKSGLGFRHNIKMDDTVGIIDADYYNTKEEGHILIKLRNEHKDIVCYLNKYMPFAQGIFQLYGTVVGDSAEGVRVGGFGSTYDYTKTFS